MENTHLNKPESLNKPLVTVAMVTYNSAAYVEAAINSVLASSYKNFELLIADDRSTDNTWDIISNYSDQRIRAWQNDNNLGEYANRQKCIQEGKGKYFLFLDGDDILYANALETYVYNAEAHPEAAMVIQKGYFNNVVFPVKLNPEQIYEWEFCRNSLLASSFSSNFFKTQLLKDINIPTNLIAGDEYVRHLLACQHPVLFISGWLTWPRETPGQASSKLINGIGLAESYYLFKLFSQKSLYPVSQDLLQKVDEHYRHLLTKLVIKNLAKRRFQLVKQIMNKACIKRADFRIRPASKPSVLCKDKNYTPANPLMQK